MMFFGGGCLDGVQKEGAPFFSAFLACEKILIFFKKTFEFFKFICYNIINVKFCSASRSSCGGFLYLSNDGGLWEWTS